MYCHISVASIENLLHSKYNEERRLALLILVHQYQSGEAVQDSRYRLYVKNLDAINHWNLVDASAHHVLGHYLWAWDRSELIRLIAIVSTWYFIRKADLDWTFMIAEMLLEDSQDLIHKAVGWMLREAGNPSRLILFLNQHASKMPRTMLRYA